MKSEQTTHVLLGIIATSVAALAAIAFERRYHTSIRRAIADANDALDHAYDRVTRESEQAGRIVGQEACSLKGRLEDSVEHLREKVVALKERVADSLERVGGHLREGKDNMKESFKQGAEDVKEGFQQGIENVQEGFHRGAEQVREGMEETRNDMKEANSSRI